jgi:hypothetical protein|tara:strand:- start:235 stop:375 length:141 start_codon:yes stop_codon:yes gene_type:complete
MGWVGESGYKEAAFALGTLDERDELMTGSRRGIGEDRRFADGVRVT